MYEIDHYNIVLTSNDGEKLDSITNDDDFVPERMASKFCYNACTWVKNLVLYCEHMKFI